LVRTGFHRQNPPRRVHLAPGENAGANTNSHCIPTRTLEYPVIRMRSVRVTLMRLAGIMPKTGELSDTADPALVSTFQPPGSYLPAALRLKQLATKASTRPAEQNRTATH
jgi:hypothetical protein